MQPPDDDQHSQQNQPDPDAANADPFAYPDPDGANADPFAYPDPDGANADPFAYPDPDGANADPFAYPDPDAANADPFAYPDPDAANADPFAYPDPDAGPGAAGPPPPGMLPASGDNPYVVIDDDQGQQNGLLAIPLSRDTLFILAILLVFIVAGGLTLWLINLGGQEEVAGPLTPTAPVDPSLPGDDEQQPGYPPPAGATATALAALPDTATPATPPTETVPPSPTSLAVEPSATPDPGGYPGPNNTSVAGGNPAPSPVGSPPAQVPTFEPTRPVVVPPTDTPLPTPIPATDTPLPTLTPLPTDTPLPTLTPLPTDTPLPSMTPEPTVPPPPTSTPLPIPTPIPPTPTPLVEVLAGEVNWSPVDGPIVVRRSLEVAPGAALVIEAGTEVRLGPGVFINVNGGQLLALGTQAQPVRFVANEGQRWEAIYGLQDSYVVLEHADVSGGGAGGTVLSSEHAELVIRRSRIANNGGTVLVTDSRLEMRESEIAGNDMPYGASLNLNYYFGNRVALINNRIGGNRQTYSPDTVASTQIHHFNTNFSLELDVQGNLFRGGKVANLLISTEGPIHGTISCNAMIGNNKGFGLRTQTLQEPAFDLVVANNFIDEHTPAIVPTYLEYGIGRGATSEVLLNMQNNWWGHDSGPYDPEGNPQGRGNAVGTNILYEPWLSSPPECAPHS